MFKGSIFYIGYLVGQYPSGLALQKLPIGKFLSIVTLRMIIIPCPLLALIVVADFYSLGRNPYDHSGLP